MTTRPDRPADPTVTVVIPTRNEAANLPHVLPFIGGLADEVIVVDGGSTDGTVGAALRLRPDTVIVHQQHRGKGAALSAGFAAATGDITVFLDADGSMEPGEIPLFVAALTAGADVAKGTRAGRDGGASDDLTVIRRAGNRALCTAANILHGADWSELAYGYAALWTDLVVPLGLHRLDRPGPGRTLPYGAGFEIEALLFTRALRAGLTVVEVPSYEKVRIHGTSNLNAAVDGPRVLTAIVAERLRRTPTLTPAASATDGGVPAAAHDAAHDVEAAGPALAAVSAGAGGDAAPATVGWQRPTRRRAGKAAR